MSSDVLAANMKEVIMSDIQEKDWKVYKELKDKVLQKACKKVIENIMLIINDDKLTNHDKYLNMLTKMHEEREEIAQMFDHFARSMVIQHVTLWARNDLINDQEISLFSKETQDKIIKINNMMKTLPIKNKTFIDIFDSLHPASEGGVVAKLRPGDPPNLPKNKLTGEE